MFYNKKHFVLYLHRAHREKYLSSRFLNLISPVLQKVIFDMRSTCTHFPRFNNQNNVHLSSM
jgi:hypothetical protein